MKEKITIFIVALTSLLAPVELSVICLMGIILIDTIVKLISLKYIAKKDGRKYRDVFKSKMLRRGYIFKSLGYAFLAVPLFPLDYFVLTPFLDTVLKALDYNIVLNKAVLTNGLLIIFAIIELASINENWFDISGNNVLSGVWVTVKKIRRAAEGVAETYRNIKK
jgi:hypothetical protein